MAREYQKAFGAHIKRLRKQRGYSQDSFAAVVNLTQAYLSSMERGIANPRLDTLQKIAGGLEISLSDLFLFDVLEPDTAQRKEKLISTVRRMSPKVVDELYLLLCEELYKRQ